MPAGIHVLSVCFTGILVAEALAGHRDRSKFTFAIAGRSQEKIDAVVVRPLLSGINTHRDDISNVDELNKLVAGFKVVINCTLSRYWDLGIPGDWLGHVRPLALITYLDLTGELPFYLKPVSLCGPLRRKPVWY
ncbi:hypothetical protein C8R47DRAFT_48650 [Mycena vitilis]|nr:hypothetical protein C8R47DRAFT_48650 [Mycena vitilis]